MSRAFLLTCDICGDDVEFEEPSSVYDCLASARHDGWKVDVTEDRCPECREDETP